MVLWAFQQIWLHLCQTSLINHSPHYFLSPTLAADIMTSFQKSLHVYLGLNCQFFIISLVSLSVSQVSGVSHGLCLSGCGSMGICLALSPWLLCLWNSSFLQGQLSSPLPIWEWGIWASPHWPFPSLPILQCIDCKSNLGGSEAGAEVRIRNRQLYCNSCYMRFKSEYDFSWVPAEKWAN